MPTIELSEEVYRRAVERTSAGGFSSVSDYVEDALIQDAIDDDMDRFLTPERLARIAAGQADVAAARSYTSAEVDAHFAKRRAERVVTP